MKRRFRSSYLFPEGFSPEVKVAATVARAAGLQLRSDKFGRVGAKDAVEKGDEIGHHAVVSPADVACQNLIVEQINCNDGGLRSKKWILAEEKGEQHPAITITAGNLNEVLGGVGFVIDAIDGTNQHVAGLWECAVSIGVVSWSQNIGGAIYAPYVRGGMLVFGERGRGVCFVEQRKTKFERVSNFSKVDVKQSLLYIGPDVNLQLNRFGDVLQQVAPKLRAILTCGSCALGLAAVVLGRVGAILQPHQYPWDWVAMLPLVEEVGGKVCYYHYREGKIRWIDVPDLESYRPDKRMLGFLAGHPQVVDYVRACM